jgi:N6-L-threonylcarbamoyladenine synthase
MNPKILAIDTSCDETSVAVIQGRMVLSNIRASQVDLHSEWGGVVPLLSKRAHEENIQSVYEDALRRAKTSIEDVDYIAVTYGPGLAIDLEVGIEFAKDLALKYDKPLVPINHMEGHLLSSLVLNSKGNGLITGEQLEGIFPALGLLVSGKHTELIYVKGIGKYEKIGQTLDDAAGEAFDKVGRMLNFGYPGGPVVSEFAKKGKRGRIELPVPMAKSGDLNFSYSGLKTACLYKIKELRESGVKEKEWVHDFCRTFVDVLTESLKIKLKAAVEKHPEIKSVLVGGGVFGSEFVLREVGKLIKSYGLQYLYPQKDYRTDNAGMIGVAAHFSILSKQALTGKKEIEDLDRNPRLSL